MDPKSHRVDLVAPAKQAIQTTQLLGNPFLLHDIFLWLPALHPMQPSLQSYISVTTNKLFQNPKMRNEAIARSELEFQIEMMIEIQNENGSWDG